MKTCVLIDSNALIHRSYHAVPPTLTSPSGQQTNAVYGFTGILLGILEQEKPDYLAAAFDKKGPTFRHEVFKEYKATRAKTDDALIAQFPLVRSVLQAFSVPIFEKSGFEADDYLGILSHEIEQNHPDVKVLLITNDQDAMQLVSDRVTLVSPVSGYKKVTRYNREGVFNKLGVWPEQVVDYKGLRGDTSDNIPGVPGIGPKTAVKLLEEFKSLEGIYGALEQVEPARIQGLLREHEDSARLSKKLATILREDGIDFDLEACAVHDFDPDKVRALFHELAFKAPLRRVEGLVKRLEKERPNPAQASLF